MSVTKTIVTSKPFYVVAGAGDLAVKSLREGTDRLSALRIERKDLAVSFSTLQTETRALPAKAQSVAVTLVADVAGKVGNGYDELLDRGRTVVTRVRRQQSTRDLQHQATTTVGRSRATVTAAKQAAGATRSSAKGTATTAKKRAARTKKAAKSTATSARRTTATARKTTSAASAKVGK